MTHPVFARIAAIADRTPDAVALVCGAERVTYGALIARARALGDARGWGPGDLVAICIPRSTEYIVAALSVWAHGAAFAPLSPDDPSERLRELLDGCRASWLITSDLSCRRRPNTGAGGAHDLALSYVIHTSGSTGKPKAVMMHAGGLMGVIDAQITAFHVTERARVLWMLSPRFDASLSDIGCALCAGATLVIAPADMAPHDLARFLYTEKITHADVPPSYLRHLDPARAPETLQTLVIGGEVPPPQVVSWSMLPGVQVINVYGPTETTICASTQPVDAAFDPTRIGAPLPGVLFRVCAPDQPAPDAPLPAGMPGELWIGGAHVGLGYMGAPEQTAARFVTDADGVRWYRTGDRCALDADGSARFLGRLDRQLKRNGLLISPEEIEAHLLQHPGARRVHVAEASRGVLGCAYEGDASPAALQEWLRARLPVWMIPDVWRPLDALPLSHAGKIQPHLIPWSVPPRPAPPGAPPNAPPSPARPHAGDPALVAWLLAVGSPVLGMTLDATQSFASQGGDSLAALEIAALAAAEGFSINPEALMSAPRLEDMRADDRMDADALRRMADALPLPPGHGCSPSLSRRVLLTGATGQLGEHVLQALLARGVPVICLVRATSAPLSHDVPRIVGDLRLPDLGISAWDRARLDGCTDIIHCAGVVNLARDMAFHRGANLDALHHLINLQATLGCRLHHVSTLSVFVHTDHVPPRCEEDDPLDDARVVFGGYAQSKLAADRLAQRASRTRPLQIYRPGLLTAPADEAPHTGAPRAELLTMTLRGLARLGVYPAALAEVLRVDITPLDWAADRLVTLALGDAPGPHHLSFGSATLGQLAQALTASGHPMRAVGPSTWATIPASLLSGADARVAWLALSRRAQDHAAHHAVDLFQATATRFTDAQAPRAEIDALLHTYARAATRPRAQEPTP